jgi:SH3-like domain-containing protein
MNTLFGLKGGWPKKAPLAAMAGLLLTGMAAGPARAESKKAVPYWASISEKEARMRVGPSLDYPSNWIYRRRDLPVKVVQVLGNWRKIEDSAGAHGWMHVRLLSDTRTAIVTSGTAQLRSAANDDAPIVFRAEQGVVGRLTDCAGNWCLFNVGGQRGFVRTDELWGGIR